MTLRKLVFIFLVLLGIDIASKEAVVSTGAVFYVFNTDTALTATRFLLFVFLIAVAYLWRKQPLVLLGATALLAGGIGNALYAGAVPDFVLIPSWVPGSETGQIFPAPNSAANIADFYIWGGAVLFVIGLLKGRNPVDCGAKVG